MRRTIVAIMRKKVRTQNHKLRPHISVALGVLRIKQHAYLVMSVLEFRRLACHGTYQKSEKRCHRWLVPFQLAMP